MADRVNAAPAEHASVVKAEPCKEAVDTHQSPEVGSRTLNAVDCTNTSKHSSEGNGDGKLAKPGKDVTGVAGKGGKSPENEVFIPAPPPTTNAWTKRMQASCSAAKHSAESVSADDKLLSDSSKKPSANPTPAVTSAKSDPQSSMSRLECSVQTESTSSAAGRSSKHLSAENAENTSSSKQTAEAWSTAGSEASAKAEVQVKSALPAVDTAPGGCWKKPVAAARVQSAGETSVAQGSSATKRQSAEQPAGKLFVALPLNIGNLTMWSLLRVKSL